MTRILFTCMLLVVAQAGVAQKITGQVLDHAARLPIPYAHLTCAETGDATVTDERGRFTLILKNQAAARTLLASFVGYRSAAVRLADTAHHYIIYLAEDTTHLAEVVVSPPDPLALIRASLEKIPVNHGGSRLLTCFYRMPPKTRTRSSRCRKRRSC